MNKVRIATEYNELWLEVHRPQTLIDRRLESLALDITKGNFKSELTDKVYQDFKEKCLNYIVSSKLNKLTGFETAVRQDVCIGCTQFIDNLYMLGPVQVLSSDYRYHQRLAKAQFVDHYSKLIAGVPFIVAAPFPGVGAVHYEMEEMLNFCSTKGVPVHIDGAWVTCSKDLNFDFSHPAIESFAISLSKGLGLGWNRIGVRWTKKEVNDSISIMNDYQMNNRALAIIANHFLDNVEPDYLWNKHRDRNLKICNDFNLIQTNSIHIVLKNNQPVGIAPLIRYLEENEL